MTSKWAQRQPDFSHLSLEELGVYRETVVVGGGGHQVEEESLINCYLIKLLCFVIKQPVNKSKHWKSSAARKIIMNPQSQKTSSSCSKKGTHLPTAKIIL